MSLAKAPQGATKLEIEGVIKFRILRDDRASNFYDLEETKDELMTWLSVLRKIGWIGVDPKRYGGLGFGNLSFRIGSRRADGGQRSFVITGSQTGAISQFTKAHIATVSRYRLRDNLAWKTKGIDPSSESLTHAAVYEGRPNARVCFHIHCPTIWRARRRLKLPEVSDHIAYGTPEMSSAIRHLCRQQKVPFNQPIAMAGHEDGIVCFSNRAADGFAALIEAFRASTA